MHLRVRHAICLLALLLCMGASIAFAAQPDDVEASDIKTKADVLAGFKDPLQQRVAQLNRLTIATICFAALGGICGAMTSSKAKVASAVAAAVVVALTSVRVQVYHADIDSADAILAELEDLDDRVQSQFGLYKVNADQVNSERLRRGSATAAQDPEFASGMAEIEANAGKALEQLRRIDTDRLKLKKRVGSIGVTGTAKPSSADTGSLSVFPVVYAAGRNEPGWMKSLPNDPDYLQDRGESVCSA